MNTRTLLAGIAMATFTVAAVGSPVGAQTTAEDAPVPGSTRSGDSLFPTAGNGGYDVHHYRLDLGYRPAHNMLHARARIVAAADHPLSSFSLDLQGLRVRSVEVDNRAASSSRHGHELVIKPAAAVDGRFVVSVVYSGHPRRHQDPDESYEGWIKTPDGATALNEPVGSMTWFPVNNTPRDKASYTFRVTAPSALAVAANGVLTERVRHDRSTTWTWRVPDPMAAHLAMVSIGDYDVFRSTMRTTSGRRLPVWSFVERQLDSQRKARRLLPAVVRWGERHFGPYPFRSTGLVAHRLSVGYALETQDRPVFPGAVDTPTLVHEIAHQWYGNSVTPRDWGDIWLNEGFATYAEWLWEANHGGPSTEKTFRDAYRKHGPKSKLWKPAPAAFTDPADLFGEPVYLRGAMALQALRDRVGGPDFNRILRSWARLHRYSGVSTEDFTKLSEQVSGRNLDKLFDDWLYTAGRPKGY